jgi:hypothetical protein
MKTSNQALRMYIVYNLYYDFIGYSWSFSTNTGNIFFRLNHYLSILFLQFLFHSFKKRKVQFHLGGWYNEVENYYTILINCNTLKIIFINSSDNI